MSAVANKKYTDHPHLNALTIARIINRLHGGPVITAMEVDQLDEDWIDSMLGVAIDLPAMQARQNSVTQWHQSFEADYRKRLH